MEAATILTRGGVLVEGLGVTLGRPCPKSKGRHPFSAKVPLGEELIASQLQTALLDLNGRRARCAYEGAPESVVEISVLAANPLLVSHRINEPHLTSPHGSGCMGLH